MSSISAKIVADSVSPTGSRLTTVEACYPRFIHSELMTHRAFSRNAASSRAIPIKRVIEQVRNNPAMPIEFGSNQKGMQAGPEIGDHMGAKSDWLLAAEYACTQAELMSERGVHKQVCNRLLEPFVWMTTIITSTEAGWSNFFDQRISPLAQPEINALAIAISDATDASEPMPLGYGDWHLPYVDDMDPTHLNARKISAARCARVSYLTHDGKRDLRKDIELYDKLVSADPPHWSPLEHVATPINGYTAFGNFDGWSQLRHLPEYQ